MQRNRIQFNFLELVSETFSFSLAPALGIYLSIVCIRMYMYVCVYVYVCMVCALFFNRNAAKTFKPTALKFSPYYFLGRFLLHFFILFFSSFSLCLVVVIVAAAGAGDAFSLSTHSPIKVNRETIHVYIYIHNKFHSGFFVRKAQRRYNFLTSSICLTMFRNQHAKKIRWHEAREIEGGLK